MEPTQRHKNMAEITRIIGDIVYLAATVCFALCTLSQLAQLVRNAFKPWQSPTANSCKSKRKTSR